MRVNNLVPLNALLHVLENGGKWRRLPKEYGRWHTIYNCTTTELFSLYS